MIGQTLGPYRILEQIGLGGMATVYKAYHAAMDRFVAVKVLPPHLAQDPEFSARFAQETRTIAKLEHPYILPVYDSGSHGGTAYLVMRYMETGTLTDLLARGRPDLRYTIRLIQHVAEALDHAHSQGIVHRDIKPSNILIDKNGQPYLTDFGIAKIIAGSLHLTGSGIIGTPAYMSPEQGQGHAVDHRSDIYSLGVVLYEMAAGAKPFEAETPMAVLLKHINSPLPPPRSLRPDIPPELERIILKAMAKDPGDRFPTAGHLARALENLISDVGRPAATMVEPAPGVTATVAERPPTGERQPSPTGLGAVPPPSASAFLRRATQTQAAQPSPTYPQAAPGRTATRAAAAAPPKPPSRRWVWLGGCAVLLALLLIAAGLAAYFATQGLPISLLPGLASVDDTATLPAALTETQAAALALATEETGTPTLPVAGVTPTTPAPTASPLPSGTPTLTLTPSATPCVEDAKFVADVTVPDNTPFPASTPFVKTWRVQNSGTCPWDSSYTLRFVGGEQMGGASPLAFPGPVAPGGTMDISVSLTAPATAGTFTGQWRLTNPAGNFFGTNNNPLTVVIVVPATPTPTPTATDTPTPTPTPAFAVTGVTASVAPSSSAACPTTFNFTAQITVNSAGTVTYKWERSDGAGAPVESVAFAGPGTQSVATTWTLSGTYSGWERVSILSPNALTSNQANFTLTCPPAGPTTVILSASSSGGVYSPPATVFAAPNAGDDEANRSRQGFATFSLASIPSGVTITAVRLDLSPFDQLGNPFSLGCLRGYQHNYGALDPSDFFSGTALGALWRFCSAADVTNSSVQAADLSGIAAVQNSLASGQFQIRLQYNQTATNNNGVADLLRPTPRLIVTYTGP